MKLTISGTSTRISECFDLTDVIPSGARYFSSYYDSSYSDDGEVHTGAHVYNTAGQKMSGFVWVYNTYYSSREIYNRTECPEYSFSVTVSYVIRGAVKGEFVVEPAVIRNLGANVYFASERHTVTITDGEWIINKQ